MAQNQNEEIDLLYLLNRVKSFYHSCLAGFYKGVQFVKKYWIVLLIILVGGYFGGQFWQRSLKQKREALLIVQNNFGSSSYVYQAVELLSMKSKQEDRAFLKKYGFNPDDPEIQEITIEPIVSIKDLLEGSEPNDRNIETYISKVDFEEELLLSEVFYPQYHYHKITVKTDVNDGKIITKVMDYLNSNAKFNEIKAVVVKETHLRIERNNQTIANIDALFDEYSGKNDRDLRPSEVYMKTQENNNLHQLVEKKTELIKENEYLKTELTKYNKVVFTINQPYLYRSNEFFDKKKYLLPFTLLFLFISFFVIRNLYRKGQKYAKE